MVGGGSGVFREKLRLEGVEAVRNLRATRVHARREDAEREIERIDFRDELFGSAAFSFLAE